MRGLSIRAVRGLASTAFAFALVLGGGPAGVAAGVPGVAADVPGGPTAEGVPGGPTAAGVPGGPTAALAASPGLTLVTAATYTVQPSAHRVAVKVAITATNHLQDSATKRYYFRTAEMAVLPGTSSFRLSTSGASASVSVAGRTSRFTLLKLNFGANLAAGRTRALTLTFELKDPGGAPDRPIRISPSLVSFYAWAYATPSTPGSSVTITFPAGYGVTIGRGPMTGPTTGAGGAQTWSSGRLDAPLAFIADVTADHPGADVVDDRSVTIGDQQANLEIRSWPDDAPWRTRVGDLVAKSLPILSDEIGLPWPIQQPLVVQEALVRSTGGYAGLFDPSQHLIEVSFAAPSAVVLHEAAHAWFNGALVADRWAAEAFASYYAEQAGAALKIEVASPELDASNEESRIPLNAWGPLGAEPAATETYAYAASLALARAIAQRAGAGGLQRVWALAASGTPAYQPPSGAPETGAPPPDWRGLLDLLEDTTHQSYVDLWRTWVARPQDLAALDARAAARTAYAAAVADAADWPLPSSIRQAMRAWQFDAAQRQLTAAEAVLHQRATLQQAATTNDLQLPPTLLNDFVAGDLTAAIAEGSAELTTIGQIANATAIQGQPAGVVETIGLIGTDSAGDVQVARADFAHGDLSAAARSAAIVTSDRATASDIGRGRIVSAIALGIAVVLCLVLIVGRRRRPSAAPDGLHSAP